MPIYAYKCGSCGHSKDVLQKISDAPLVVCPACGEPAFSKQLTAAGFQLKGSGWYATDFKGGKAPAEKKDADGKSGEKSDSKNDGKSDSKSDSKSDGKSDGNKSDGKSDGKNDKKTDSKSDGKSDAKTSTPSDTSAKPPKPAAAGGSGLSRAS